jgi:hypothetical protein
VPHEPHYGRVMGTIVRLDKRVRAHREVPAYRLAETGMEVQARAHDIRHGIEEISRHAWAARDPWILNKISHLLPALAALDVEGKRIAGWGESADCADGIDAPGHGAAVGS